MKNWLSFFVLFMLTCAATCKKAPDQQSSCIDESKIDPEAMCYEIYQPVCGCDGKTYPNDCYAQKAGVTSWKEGSCCIDESKIDPQKACIQVYDPVCGCDKETYSNSCEAEKAGITEWTNGPCPTDEE